MTLQPSEITLVEGDNYKVRLVRRGPGDVIFLLEIDGKSCGELPFDNMVKATTRIDPDHASAAEKQIAELRREVAEARGKVFDMEHLRTRLQQVEHRAELAENERAAALAELRQGQPGPGPAREVDPARPLLVQTTLRPEQIELLLYIARKDGLNTETLMRMALGNWLDGWRKAHPCTYEFEQSDRKSSTDVEHLANCPLLHAKRRT